jgi:hypothetical protein
VIDSQKQEHKLGNSFKYEILSCLPPIMAGKMMLQVVKLDVPQNIQWHLVDAITLQFATSAIEFGRSDLSTVASNWQSSGINGAQGVRGTVAAAAKALLQRWKNGDGVEIKLFRHAVVAEVHVREPIATLELRAMVLTTLARCIDNPTAFAALLRLFVV